MEQMTSTQQKLLDAGRTEFMQKGFQGSSLRHIVRQAGFTQGAFYGYYPDKEALFEALVEPAAGELLKRFLSAQDAHFDLIPEEATAGSRELSTAYLHMFLTFIYENFDSFKLICCHAAGTKYEDYLHRLVEIEVSRTEEYYAELRKLGKLQGEVNPEVHHMLTSAYFTAVFETVVHDMPFEKAKQYVSQLAVFFNCGWEGLTQIL